MIDKTDDAFAHWAILELMGHRRIAGYVTEQTVAGAAMLRIDMPTAEGDVTQFYGGAAVYAITPCSEDVARRFAGGLRLRPVHKWDLLPGPGGDDPDDGGAF